MLRREPLVVYGDGEQTRDYVHVGDVVNANLLAARMKLSRARGIDARAYNVATGTETSVNRLAAALEDAAAIRTGRVFRDARPGELRRSALAAEKIADRGWAPSSSLREGLAATFEAVASATTARVA